MLDCAKIVVIITGPNGAGKTTFAHAFLAQAGIRFINADLIAAGLSPFAPARMALRAGRLMLEEIAVSTAGSERFAFETTRSGLGWLRHIHQWRNDDWRVVLYFLALQEVEIAITRVEQRVRQGGHAIPESVIRRRFVAGLRNFEQYDDKPAVSLWKHYDNSNRSPHLLSSGETT